MPVNLSPLTIAVSSWVAGLDGKLRGADPTGLLGGSGSDLISMSIALTTAGRLGFYIDYSELATTGTHTFYVTRTHGTAGAVSCGYTTGGDAHTGTARILRSRCGGRG